MKKQILFITKFYLLQTFVVYILCYLVNCFIKFELQHIFKWFIDLPTRDNNYRANSIFFYILYWIISMGIWKGLWDEKIKRNINQGNINQGKD